MVGSGVEERDLGWNRITREMAKIARDKLVVDIGVIGNEADEDHGDGLTNVILATIHEFGGKKNHPPERSFLRSTMIKNGKRYMDLMRKGSKKFFESGVSGQDFLGLLGQRVVADVQRTIVKKIPPPLEDATIDRKGGNKSTPLIDTGQLKGSITYLVRKETEGK